MLKDKLQADNYVNQIQRASHPSMSKSGFPVEMNKKIKLSYASANVFEMSSCSDNQHPVHNHDNFDWKTRSDRNLLNVLETSKFLVCF